MTLLEKLKKDREKALSNINSIKTNNDLVGRLKADRERVLAGKTIIEQKGSEQQTGYLSSDITEKLKTTFVSAPDVIKNINKVAGITEKPISTTESKKTTEQPEPDTQQKSALLKTLTTPILSQITKKPADTAKESTLPAETIKKLKTEPLSVTSAIENVSNGTAAKKQATEKPTSTFEVKSPTGKGFDEVRSTLAKQGMKKIAEKYADTPNYWKLPEYQNEVSAFLEKFPEMKSTRPETATVYNPEATKGTASNLAEFLASPEAARKTVSYLGEKAKQGLFSGAEGLQSMAQQGKNTGTFTVPELIREDVNRQKTRFAQSEQENVSGALKITGDVIQGTAQMIPTILISATNPAAGLFLIGGQTAGNATQEALDKGATRDQAIVYGLISGGIESLVEGLVGGLPFMKGFTDKAINKALKPIKSKLVKILANRVIDAGGEAVEEVISGVLNPLAKKATYNAQAQFPKLNELLYEGGIAAIIAGAMNVPVTVSDITEITPSIKEAKAKVAVPGTEVLRQPQPATAEQQLQQQITTPKTDMEKLAEEIRKETGEKLKQTKTETKQTIEEPLSQSEIDELKKKQNDLIAKLRNLDADTLAEMYQNQTGNMADLNNPSSEFINFVETVQGPLVKELTQINNMI
jgi:hypothetical protein